MNNDTCHSIDFALLRTKILQEYGSLSQFSRDTDINYKTLYNILHQKHLPNHHIVTRISEILDFDEETYIAVFAPYILNRRSPYPRLQIIPLPKKDKED